MRSKFRMTVRWALWAALGLVVAPAARAENNILIDPDQESVSATSYYATFGQVPSKMVDNSGLSSELPTGTPVPVSDASYPTHDTALIDMYRSGKDTHPDLFFSLNGTYQLSALHYWNFNGDNRDSHPTGGDRETPGDGIASVDIAVSTSSVAGPYTTIGTYALEQAPVLPTYTGATLSLGTPAAARYVRFHINSNFSGAGPDASGYFGLSELRFIGHAQAGDVNLDGAVNFTDLLTLAQHYGATTAATRDQGDLNGDGAINFNDLLVLAQNYGQNLTASQLAQLTPQFQSDVAAAFAQVPEPAQLGILFLVVGALTRRKHSGSSISR